ncbi:hypothetical protein D3C71_1579310 [compost metagenome]
MSSSGSEGELMCCAFQRTSASIARNLLRSNALSGSTVALAASCAAWAFCWALADSVPPVLGGAPTKPARSSKSSRRDSRLAVSLGRSPATSICTSPDRSLSPTRPVNFS